MKKPNERHARTMAIMRVFNALERADKEESHLAAPDGTVAIDMVDLRAVLDVYTSMQDTLALGKTQWVSRWNGSEPERGSAIWSVDDYGRVRRMVAYFGGDEATHALVGKVVSTHNAALVPTP